MIVDVSISKTLYVMKLLNHPLSALNKAEKNNRYLFSNEAILEAQINEVDIELSTFKRVALKDGVIRNSRFTQSVFSDCYFRNTKFKTVDFTGSVFVNCNFKGAGFQSCNFRYCTFINSSVPVDEIKSCLPSEHNMRNDLCRNLKVNFQSIGDKKSSDLFLRLELSALRHEMACIFTEKSQYYKENFSTIDKVKNFASWLKLIASGFMYGHGIKVRWLFISYLTLSTLLALTICCKGILFLRVNTLTQTQELMSLNLLHAWYAVFSESIKYSFVDVQPTDPCGVFIMCIARILGLLYLGLITATMYRKIAR